MLDVRRLRVLREVALRGSISAAASELSYTASAVSQQIAALEREAGAVLLERRARGVALTEAGHVLVRHAGLVLGQLEAAEAELAALSDLSTGRLRMATFATAGASLLPLAVEAFRRRHPDIALSVQQASPQESVARLRDGVLDLAITVDLAPAPVEGVEVIHLFDDPVQLALHRDHPLARRPDLRLADLREETWIDVPRLTSGGNVLARACELAGFRPKVAFESDDYTAIQELVGAGVGLALLPDLALCPPHESVVLRSLDADRPSRAIQAATRKAPFRSPATAAMLAILRIQRPARRDRSRQPAAMAPPSR